MGDVRLEVEAGIALITIDRPEVRNAIDGPTAGELSAIFRAFDAVPTAPKPDERAIPGLGRYFIYGH